MSQLGRVGCHRARAERRRRLSAGCRRAESPAGMWDATVVVNTAPAGADRCGSRSRSASRSSARSRRAPTSKGSFFNGDEKVTSTTGSVRERRADAQLRRVRDEARGDAQGRPARRPVHARHARRAVSVPGEAIHAGRRSATRTSRRSPACGTCRCKSSKGESAWQLIVRQSGAEASAAILRVDGDTGTLTGTYRDGKFVLSHFSGARPLRLELTPGADGTLAVVQNKDDSADRGARGAGAREGTAGAERSVALHQREGSDRAAAFQLPGSRREARVEHRCALPRQGRHRQHRAAAGARTATTKRRSSSSCTRSTRRAGSRSWRCRSRKKRS